MVWCAIFTLNYHRMVLILRKQTSYRGLPPSSLPSCIATFLRNPVFCFSTRVFKTQLKKKVTEVSRFMCTSHRSSLASLGRRGERMSVTISNVTTWCCSFFSTYPNMTHLACNWKFVSSYLVNHSERVNTTEDLQKKGNQTINGVFEWMENKKQIWYRCFVIYMHMNLSMCPLSECTSERVWWHFHAKCWICLLNRMVTCLSNFLDLKWGTSYGHPLDDSSWLTDWTCDLSGGRLMPQPFSDTWAWFELKAISWTTLVVSLRCPQAAVRVWLIFKDQLNIFCFCLKSGSIFSLWLFFFFIIII